MAWERLLLAAATTLASSSLQAIGQRRKESCAAQASCAAADKTVAPLHVLVPLMLPVALALFAYAPTLFLSSRHRVRSLWAAVAKLAVYWVGVWAVSATYVAGSPAFAYALSLHLAALFIAEPPPPTLLLSSSVHAAARCVAMTALVAGAWYAGPPVPVFDTPSFHGYCGATAHLVAWAASETVGRAALDLVSLLGAH
jgi:hypothetical protein